jgi:hypothetical protein
MENEYEIILSVYLPNLQLQLVHHRPDQFGPTLLQCLEAIGRDGHSPHFAIRLGTFASFRMLLHVHVLISALLLPFAIGLNNF